MEGLRRHERGAREKLGRARAGLGWIGKNTLLLHPQHGSYLFLAEALIDRKLGLGPNPLPDYCGHCTRCLERLPHRHVTKPHSLDSNRCISYWTLEQKTDRPISKGVRRQAGTWIAGCDLCQEVCPVQPEGRSGGGKLRKSRQSFRASSRLGGASRGNPRRVPRSRARELAWAREGRAVRAQPRGRVRKRRSGDATRGERCPLHFPIPALRARLERENDPELKPLWEELLALLVN